jgi:protein involved in polysaccharide export with SLBB domain
MRTGIALLSLALLVSAAPAQTPEELARILERSDPQSRATSLASPATSPALSGPIDPATYRLGPGDRLLLQWSGRLTRTDLIDVGPEGDVYLSEAGTLNVAGQTLAAARAAILERLRRVVRDVRVDVSLARPRTFRVFVSGAVTDPGPAEAVGGSRVGDVLTASRLAAGASRRNIRVRHRDGTVEVADLDRLLRLGDHSRDPWLLDGDAIIVPVASGSVSVGGAVRSPGDVEFAEGDSVGTLLRLGGGATPDAARDHAAWLHWTADGRVDTLAVTLPTAHEVTPDGPLALGDRLLVRALPDFRASGAVDVVGEVARPGGYPVRLAGTRLSEVLAAAGGLLPSADATAVHIHRPSGSAAAPDPDLASRLQAAQRDLSVSEYEALQARLAGRSEDLYVDWSRVPKSSALDPLLENGDVVTVNRFIASVRVDGQVAHPGLIAYAPGRSVRDYLRAAGGPAPRAWQGHEQIVRAGSAHTLLARAVRAPAAGDLIWVPTRPEDSVWRKARDLLSALGQVATIVIAIRSVR